MTRKQVILAILFFVGISTYGQHDENGNYLQLDKNVRQNLKSKSSQVEISNSGFQFDSMRALSEINLLDNGEAYPWISNDGLRLYFTTETDSVFIIVMSEREHVDSLFGTPQALSMNTSLFDNLSPWLSDDELDIYFIIKESYNFLITTLYHSHRNSLKDEFGVTTRINLLGNVSGFLACPSLTIDMEKLYIYNSDSDDNILIFEKTVDDTYLLTDTLQVPDGYIPGPGKLGQNDLKYYLSLGENYNNQKLYVYIRDNTNDSFDSIYYLNNDTINNSSFNNCQPAISNNGNYFVYTRSTENSWSSNDLYIASNNISPTGFKYNLHNNDEISIYPNPSTENLAFEFNKVIDSDFTISIYTINGIFVESKIISKNNSKIVVPTTKYNSGVYLYEIASSGSCIKRGKFIVKNY